MELGDAVGGNLERASRLGREPIERSFSVELTKTQRLGPSMLEALDQAEHGPIPLAPNRVEDPPNLRLDSSEVGLTPVAEPFQGFVETRPAMDDATHHEAFLVQRAGRG